MRVRFTAGAIRQIQQISDYISKDSPAGAQRVVERIRYLADMLRDHPEMGRVADLKGLRVLPVSTTPYLIHYTIHRDEVRIIRVRHGARRRLL